MTAQAMRARRRQREEQRRHELVENLKLMGMILYILLAFAIAGTSDFADTQAQVERWERQGITIDLGW